MCVCVAAFVKEVIALAARRTRVHRICTSALLVPPPSPLIPPPQRLNSGAVEPVATTPAPGAPTGSGLPAAFEVEGPVCPEWYAVRDVLYGAYAMV